MAARKPRRRAAGRRNALGTEPVRPPEQPPERPPEQPAEELGTYEVRVSGPLGPLLLASLPHTAAARVEGQTVLITEADNHDLVDVLARIVGSGLEVESVRHVARGTVPEQGSPPEEEGSTDNSPA